MSQLLDSVTDIANDGYTPTPVGQVICGTGQVNAAKLYSAVPVGSIASVTFRMQCPAQVPVDNTNITIECEYLGGLTPVPPDTFTGTQCDIQVTHDSLGLISQFTGFGFALGGSGTASSTPILLNDLLAALGTTADVLFGSLPGFDGPLLVFIAVSVSVDPDGNPFPDPNDSLVFQLLHFRFSVPEGTGGIIEYTGDGGIEVNGAADVEFPLVLAVTGSGGVEVSGAPQTVLSKDPTGIYTLISGQHFDRIYSRNTSLAQTQDVKIPNPFGKSGFVGS